MPRKAQNIPANEKTDARFMRVAQIRVNAILSSYKRLGTLGDPKIYESTPMLRKQLAEALHAGLEQALDSLNKGGATVQEFKFQK
jgi:hypothetical protein